MFLCQRESFLKQCDTLVLSCNEVQREEIPDLGKTTEQHDPLNKYFELILEDTILFPEGGGQPDDRGFIENVPVSRVIRRGNQAIHYVKMTSSFENKQKVSVKLDWERRFDNMQQHSGQHLITAVADTMFGFPTTSWWLGDEDSHIELDTKEIDDSQIADIEKEVNLKIRENVPVTVDVVELDSPKLKTARGRNLPEDVKGQIRIVTMDGIESNVCCGTHVSSLSQLQVIKLLFAEKKKGKVLLHFVVGNRVLAKLGETFQREQKLVQIIRTCPSDLVVSAEKLNDALKSAKKSAQTLGKDLAVLEAKNFKNKDDNGDLWHYHRDNVELDFGMAFLRELGDTRESMVLVTIKTEGSSGCFILRSPTGVTDLLAGLGAELCQILEGKGTVRGNVYQAKVSRINVVNKALKAAQGFMKKHKTNC